MKKKLYVIIAGIIGGILTRWHGGGIIKDSPKLLKAALWALPFSYVTYAILNEYSPDLFRFSLVISAIVFGLTMAFMNTGHGQWYSLGTVWKYIKPERFDFIIAKFFGDDPRSLLPKETPEEWRGLIYDRLYYRCACGMLLKGALRVLPCAFILFFFSPMAGIVLITGGMMTSWSYQFGHCVFDGGKGATEYGEVLSGVFAFGTLAISYFVVMGGL